MNATKHSLEPWVGAHEPYRAGKFRHVIRDASGRRLVTVEAMCEEPQKVDDRMRRIVACVNACVGLPTEALESGALAKALDALAMLRTRCDVMAIDDATIALRNLGRMTP